MAAYADTSLLNISSELKNHAQLLIFKFSSAPVAPRMFFSGDDLVLDFYTLAGSTRQKQFSFASGLVRQVDVVADSKRIRILLLGGAKYKYQSRQNGHNWVFIFSEKLPARLVSGKPDLGRVDLHKAKEQNNPTSKIKALKFNRDDNGGGIVELDYAGDGRMEVKDERNGNNLVITLTAVSFAANLLKTLDVTDFATPIKYITSKSGNNSLVLLIENRNNWDYALYQLEGRLLLNIRPLNKATEAGASIPSLSTNKSDLVSFNFQNIEVRALLQLLADFSGYNILVSDGVTGTMSLKLNDVPWDQALNIILNGKALGMKREGNVIRIAPIGELAALTLQQQNEKKSQEAIEPLDTATIRLKYSQAATVQAMIQQKNANSLPTAQSQAGPANSLSASTAQNSSFSVANNSLLSSRGTILVDSRTNTLIINDTPSRLKEIKDLVDTIDIPVKQVLIAARIVEANSYFEKDLGARLLLAGVGGSLSYANSLENGVTINQNGMNSLGAAPGGFVNQNFGVAGGSSIATVFAPNSDRLIGLEVDALELQSQGRTISSPKVMTANYQPANIQQGVQIPYQQASSAGNTNIAFVNATLSLQVTPQITEDGYILLNVNLQKDTPSTTLVVQGTPAIDTNSVSTQIRVKDGSTILVGGVYIDDQQKVLQQVPVLGDIPYLGWLFKAQTTKNDKKELLIFITPRIIANSLDHDN